MPLIRIENRPLFKEEGATANWELQLVRTIRLAAASTQVPRVVRSGITVTYGVSRSWKMTRPS